MPPIPYTGFLSPQSVGVESISPKLTLTQQDLINQCNAGNHAAAARQVIARRNWFGSSSAIPGSSNVPPFVPLPPTIRMESTTPCIAFIAQVAKNGILHGISVHGTPPPPCPAQALFWTHTQFLQWHFFYFGCMRPSPPLPPTPSPSILKVLSLLDFRHGRP